MPLIKHVLENVSKFILQLPLTDTLNTLTDFICPSYDNMEFFFVSQTLGFKHMQNYKKD